MEVILLEKVVNLGQLGEMVKVKNGYGRNYLIPRGIAVPATEANRAEFEARRAELEKSAAESLAKAQSRSEQLKAMVVTITAVAGDEGRLFGSIGASDVANAFTQAGGEVTKTEVRMPTGPLRTVGQHIVVLHLHPDVDVDVTVNISAE
jgi:large subunit ribosomal protein L9